ncbi:MAG: 2-oxoacid:acceptor oxidoreductase family protein [Acidobacteria bacterium]|nr:2-oxoacid:acceptor oxidoreductase family protein [Acidobacteriota bacterium]
MEKSFPVAATSSLASSCPTEERYPGILATTDGSGAVVWVESHITQGGGAYPITPSTPMGVEYQANIANGQNNLWGETLEFFETESEHSSATVCEGFALAGGRVTNFTSGQGLILMKEVLYVIAGKHLPVVFHIGARALTSQSLNIHAGHDDVMGVSDCGWGIVFARNAQEAADLALIARRAAEDSQTPFLNVQDGFLTTHTIETVRLPEPEFMKDFVGHPAAKLPNLMDVNNPLISGCVQNQDSYMKGKIAQRVFYDQVPAALENAMKEFQESTGRRYGVVSAYRLEDAEYALVGIGSMMETAEAAADYLREHGIRVGVLHLTVFRPFPGRAVIEALAHCRAVAVLERMDDPLAESNPLTREIKAAFADAAAGSPQYPKLNRLPRFYSGSAGLGGRDIRPGDMIATVENMLSGDGKPYFVLGIRHEAGLERTADPDLRPPGAFSMRGHSIGGYGSVTTNKVLASVAGDLFGMQVQAYSKYGSEKKGLPTTYFLTLASEHVRTHCELIHVDMVSLNDLNAFQQGNALAGLAENGIVFAQSPEREAALLWEAIPSAARQLLREKRIRVFYLDSTAIAREVSSSPSLILRMQGIVMLGAFLRITPFQNSLKLSEEQLFQGVEASLTKYFGKRGRKVVEDNLRAVRRGYDEVLELPREVILGQRSEPQPVSSRS